MKTFLRLTFICAGLLAFSELSAQDATKAETTKTAEVLQSSRPDAPAASTEASAPQNGTKQEPVKKEEKKEAAKSENKPAPAASSTPAPSPSKADSKEDAPAGGTQKMAITEQGVDKTKKTQKSAQTTTTPPPSTAPADK